MTDEKALEYTNDLTIAIGRLTAAQEGWTRSFGELGASGNKVWNIISRFTSGSTFWRIQNQIRGVANVIEAWTKAQDEQQTSLIKSLEGNLGLADSLRKLKKARKDVTEDSGKGIYSMLKDDLGDAAQAKKLAEKFYDTQIKAIEKHRKKNRKRLKKSLLPGLGERFDKANPFGYMSKFMSARGDKEKSPITGALKFVKDETITPLKKLGGGLKDFFFDKGPLGPKKKDGGLDMRFKLNKENASGMKKLITKIKKFDFIGTLSKFATMGLAFLGKALMYFLLIVLGITVVAAIIKKGWPVMKGIFKSAFKSFKAAFTNLIDIFVGVFKLIKAVFRGDVVAVIRIFFKDIVWNMIKLIGNLLAGIFKVLVGLVGTVLIGLYNSTLGKLFGTIDAKATGGITKGGMTLVGEGGPELVKLPAGSRVYHNQDTRRMTGNTIHVHVNGRVGANDAEIRDIANKVAREINLRMNRTGANRVGV